MTMHSKTDYTNFLKNHAYSKGNNFWAVRKEFPAFKAVRTYGEQDQNTLLYGPHAPLDVLKRTLDQHRRTRKDQAVTAIVNLIIPKGAFLHFDPKEYGVSFGKMRANRALVHSVVRKNDKKPVAYGFSDHDPRFIYANAQMTKGENILVVPDQFSMHGGTCASGIHFFVDFDKAFNYFY